MPKQTNPSELTKNADVLIVGAGVAGLYCAWRLLDQKKSTNVVDRLNRTGSRLDTDLIKIDEPDGGGGKVRDEEGGMRFNYSVKELMALSGVLGLCKDVVPFPMGPPKDSEFGLHYFMRGQEFSVAQAAENNNAKWSELYHLADNAQEPG